LGRENVEYGKVESHFSGHRSRRRPERDRRPAETPKPMSALRNPRVRLPRRPRRGRRQSGRNCRRGQPCCRHRQPRHLAAGRRGALGQDMK